ncbi:MAG TPA: tRNA 2-thiouridine(34) synthase MnmA [Flavobacteriales bacterium]|nr:tRNA 2-thiouridine(34) synthase MnmA [Flavobacteriales bacterium]HRO39932.1 tRNA 2-thiouridine(34) synthase MnmA [Flavobacteriales bacterium]HRP82247.1 tRNA 2-thiouridine(34) synthase MnmA [Flavobacteriales bacterium]HRQ84480.1 tRNA 2-thiouridine(34) synthase MnmA [Flavobacteriales bacterium]
MSKHGRVLVAMSGGVDSSVTALMLHEQGYEVIGVTMKTWDYATAKPGKRITGCCDLDSINDARDMAVSRGFHHMIIDLREEFGGAIIGNFTREYMAGRTPNPCVLCNTFIKWEALLKRANMLDCELIATGHYANVREENGRYVVSKGADHDKDQSYVLWGLEQQNLARTRFPLGSFKKTEIREMALKSGFPNLAKKSDSYEICFIPDNDYRGFLKRKDPEAFEKLAHGKFVGTDGAALGEHDGYPFFTIGQRKGLGIALGEPMYVTEINPETNTVVLGRKEDLDKQTAWIRDPKFQKIAALDTELEAVTKVRYKDQGTPSTISMDGDRVRVDFHAKVAAIAPGQSAVFYDGDDVIGGGFIDREKSST